jgi:hypothetical protein
VTARTRRGFGLVGVILMVLILSGVGLFISYLARHADRSGRWFQHSQIAFALADAGIKQALYMLSLENSKERAGASPRSSQALSQVFTDLTGGQSSGSVSLFSSSRAADLPEALTAQLEPLAAEFSPTLEVTVEVVESKPLWEGLTEGIPLVEGERAGVVKLTSRGSVKTPVGVRVERTVTMEKGFKVVSLLPPLLGRFGLFVDPQAAQDPNVFTARYDPANGDGVAQGSVPLILRSAFAAPIVAPGSNKLDRAGFAGAVPDAAFLDKQGWVYLGPGDTGSDWVLKLTHGYGAAGESPQIIGGERVVVKFRDNDDAGFRQRFDDAFQQNTSSGCQSDLVNAGQQDEGLEHFFHGWASNYEIIGLEQPNWQLVGGGNGRTKMDFGPGESSMLRLFGPPDKCSPTIVFGPVYASTLRRASIHTQVGPPEFCAFTGIFRYVLFKLNEHGGFRKVLEAAFAGGYPDWGTNVVELPFVGATDALLSGGGDGTYAPVGILENVKPGGGGKSYSSQYFPWVSSLGQPNGIPGADLDNLLAGKMDVKEIYSGDLAAGLKAFRAALDKKSTFQVRGEAFQERLLGGEGGRELSVPGIVFLKAGGGPLSLPPDVTVKRGGILVVPGPIEIRGDIKRSNASEPLTLVSLQGDITVSASAREVQAYLVAAGGQVNIQAGGATIAGGVACRGLDYQQLRALSAPVTIAHAAETDPVGPQRASSLRAFYGGEDKVVVEGSGP